MCISQHGLTKFVRFSPAYMARGSGATALVANQTLTRFFFLICLFSCDMGLFLVSSHLVCRDTFCSIASKIFQINPRHVHSSCEFEPPFYRIASNCVSQSFESKPTSANRCQSSSLLAFTCHFLFSASSSSASSFRFLFPEPCSAVRITRPEP